MVQEAPHRTCQPEEVVVVVLLLLLLLLLSVVEVEKVIGTSMVLMKHAMITRRETAKSEIQQSAVMYWRLLLMQTEVEMKAKVSELEPVRLW